MSGNSYSDPTGLSGIVNYHDTWDKQKGLSDPGTIKASAPLSDDQVSAPYGLNLPGYTWPVLSPAPYEQTSAAIEPLTNASGAVSSTEVRREVQELRLVDADDARRARNDRLLCYDEPPPPELGFEYMLVYGIKQGIYKPIKSAILDERPTYLGSDGNVHTSAFPRDHTDAIPAVAEIGMMLLPTPKSAPAAAGASAGKIVGSGPPGMVEISARVRSANYVRNFQGPKPVDFIFDHPSGAFRMANHPLEHRMV